MAINNKNIQHYSPFLRNSMKILFILVFSFVFSFSLPSYAQQDNRVNDQEGEVVDSEIIKDVNAVHEMLGDGPLKIGSISDQYINEGEILTVFLSEAGNYSDQATYEIKEAPINVMLAEDMFLFLPDYDQEGMYKVVVIVSDNLLKDEIVFNVKVNNVFSGIVYDQEEVEEEAMDGQEADILDTIYDAQEVRESNRDVSPRLEKTSREKEKLVELESEPDKKISRVIKTSRSVSTDDLEKEVSVFEKGYTAAKVVINPSNNAGNSDVSEEVPGDVEAENNPPVIVVPSSIAIEETETVFINPQTYDADNDEISITYSGWMSTNIYETNYEDAGEHTVMITASDGKTTVSRNITIIVRNKNRAPVVKLGDNQIIVKEKEEAELKLEITDPDKDRINIELQPSYRWTKLYKNRLKVNPPVGTMGSYLVNIIVSDGDERNINTIALQVRHFNRAPILEKIDDITVNEGEQIKIKPLAHDEDGDELTYTYSGWMRSDKYVTNYKDAGENKRVTVTVSDGKLKDAVSFYVHVNNVNLPPKIKEIPEIVVFEGQDVVIKPVAMDPDGDKVLISYNGWMKESSRETGYDDTGEYFVNVTASDGDLEVSQNVKILVRNVNRPPKLSFIKDIVVNEGETVSFEPKASDPDKDSKLTFTYSGWMMGDRYVTNYKDAGEHVVTVMVSDGELTDLQDVKVTVINVNRPPELENMDDVVGKENEVVRIVPRVNEQDQDDILTWSVDGLPEGADYDFNENTGVLNWKTNYEQAGKYKLIFTVDDGRN